MVKGIEHTAIASPDPERLAQWYVDHLEFTINYRSSNSRTHFVRAPDGSMIEIIESKGAPPAAPGLRDAGIRVSLFVDPERSQLEAAVDLGAEVVELCTAAYSEDRPGELDRLRAGAALTRALGLECHAGHGLTYANVAPVAALPEMAELNIGHFLIGQAVLDGLPQVIARMRALIAEARR